MTDILKNLSLGKSSEYAQNYDPSLLEVVPRSLNRDTLQLSKPISFHGCDVWHAYELSWLNKKGKPMVALARCTIPADSPNIVESKSFKLYLNSLNQTQFSNQQDILDTLKKDISAVIGKPIKIELFSPADNAFSVTALPGDCLDDQDINIEQYQPDAAILKTASEEIVSETLHSHLLKSNCLITHQPDWASIIINYQGCKIDRASLLRYLISFRQHSEFHEHCVERIFTDINNIFQPETLSVQALYTRRGGLDINPYRSSEPSAAPTYRINRQ